MFGRRSTNPTPGEGQRTPVSGEGRVDATGRRVGRTRARFENAEERVARATSGKCSLFCGDIECPAACTGRS